MIRKLDMSNLASDVLLNDLTNRHGKIARQNKQQAYKQTDRNTDEQVRRHDCNDGDDERQELPPTFLPHRHYQFRTRELEASHQKYGREAG